jgi:hypothetical protein
MISIANVLWRTVLVGTLLKSCRVSPCGHSRCSSRRITIVPAHALDIISLIQRLPPLYSDTSRLFISQTLLFGARSLIVVIESDLGIVCKTNGHTFAKDWVDCSYLL